MTRHAAPSHPTKPNPLNRLVDETSPYLLQHKEVLDFMKRRGGTPCLVFLMFDETTQSIVKETGCKIWFPDAALRNRVDNKIETVRIGNKAGVPSVPNVLHEVESYKHLKELAAAAGLGNDLVLQSAFGDSGHTTFFIKNEADFRKHASGIVGKGEIKIMKRIRCLSSAIEACVTKRGTIVGPLMTELVGFPELTPYRGGWCGNEIFANAFSKKLREKARAYTFAFGQQLKKEGYRGYFELDLLIDRATGDLYLGELNPRITGASSMTNHAAFAHADAPLFLFHLLEFSGIPFDLDIEELNHRWADSENIDSWSQMVIKHTEPSVDIVTAAPESGIWKLLPDGRVVYDRFDYHRQAIESEQEAFFLRITGPGDYRYEGADLGILITRGRVMDDEFELNERASNWIKGIKRLYASKPLTEIQRDEAPEAGSFKIL